MNENMKNNDPGLKADQGQLSPGLEALSKMMRSVFVILGVSIIALLVGFAVKNSILIVDSTRETVLHLRFGKLINEYKEGWHWMIPSPVDTVVRVPKVTNTLRSSTFMLSNRKALLERGAKDGAEAEAMAAGTALMPGKDGYLLSGDNSILHTEWILTYKIVNPRLYYEKCLASYSETIPGTDPKPGSEQSLIETRGIRPMLRDILDDCVIRVTGSMSIKDILYEKPVEYIDDVRKKLENRLNELQLGIKVESLSLPVKSPPIQTIAAFENAFIATAQAEAEVESARSAAVEIQNSAKSESANILANAEIYSKRIVSEVKADSGYFTKILEEYNKNPDSVMVSLYSTTLADALSKVKDKFIIGKTPSSSQQVRIKLNPEPVVRKNEDESMKDNR